MDSDYRLMKSREESDKAAKLLIVLAITVATLAFAL